MLAPAPTDDEVRSFLLGTVRHVMHVEHYLQALGVGHGDPERPHDAAGEYNKLEWPVLSGLALSHRKTPSELSTRRVRHALDLHRQQYHHRMWNGPDPRAPPDALRLGAIDALCALAEDRPYDRAHTDVEIERIIDNDHPFYRSWMREMRAEMQRLPKPNLARVTALTEVPNLGMRSDLYDLLCTRVDETLRTLADRGYQLDALLQDAVPR